MKAVSKKIFTILCAAALFGLNVNNANAFKLGELFGGMGKKIESSKNNDDSKTKFGDEFNFMPIYKLRETDRKNYNKYEALAEEMEGKNYYLVSSCRYYIDDKLGENLEYEAEKFIFYNTKFQTKNKKKFRALQANLNGKQVLLRKNSNGGYGDKAVIDKWENDDYSIAFIRDIVEGEPPSSEAKTIILNKKTGHKREMKLYAECFRM